MIDQKLVREIVENSIEDDSLFVVDVLVRPGNLIVVDLDSDNGIGIDDCVALSRKIEAQLDREKEDFELEVGSVGLTKPFVLPRQYSKNIGNDVEVLTKKGIKERGVLKSASEEDFVLTVVRVEKPEGAKRREEVEYDLTFQYDEVKYTKYQIKI